MGIDTWNILVQYKLYICVHTIAWELSEPGVESPGEGVVVEVAAPFVLLPTDSFPIPFVRLTDLLPTFGFSFSYWVSRE